MPSAWTSWKRISTPESWHLCDHIKEQVAVVAASAHSVTPTALSGGGGPDDAWEGERGSLLGQDPLHDLEHQQTARQQHSAQLP